MNITHPNTPSRMEPGPEEISPDPSSNNDRQSPVVPAEDSYFKDVSSSTSRPFRDLRQLGLILNNKRRAATQHVAIRGAGAAWIDQDTSGTYDPRLERATPPVTPPQRKRRPTRISDINDDESDNSNDISRPRRRRLQRHVGYQTIIAFSFKSKKALDYLATIPAGPYDSEPNTVDDELSKLPVRLEDDNIFGPPLRRQKARIRRRASRRLNITPREDGLTIDQLTLGHPQRRGCKACFEAGDDECSLIENAHSYPCDACDDAGFDCEFIVPPEIKKSCERCKQKRISCSYRVDGGKGVSSCEACEEGEVKCLAGPLKSTAGLIGAAIESSSSPTPPVRKRVFVSCNHCRNGSKRRNLKRDQPGPCRECKKTGEACAFVLIPITASETSLIVTPPAKSKRKQKKVAKTQTRRGKKKEQESDTVHTPGNRGGRNERILGAESFYYGAGRRRQTTLRNEQVKLSEKETKKQHLLRAKADKRSSSISPTPKLNAGLISTNRILHIVIKTSFSHPITFNYIPDILNTSPCPWCTSPFFGLFGHGEVEVEVIPYPLITGHGYEEIIGGHSNGPNRKELSRMCVDCTTSRFIIMGCDRHEFVGVEADPRHLIAGEMEKSIQALLVNDKKGGELAEQTRWCSICPLPAALECCTRQTLDESVENGRGEIEKHSSHASEVLDRTIHHASRDRFNYAYGVRADASFLTADGELRVRMERHFGEFPVELEEEKAESSEGEDGDDSEAMSIFERIGKGKGKWCAKPRVARAYKPSKVDTQPIPETQRKKQNGTGMGARLSSQGSREGQNQTGLRGVIDCSLGDHGSKRVKTQHDGESSQVDNRKEGVGVKGKGTRQKISEIVVISDDDED
ncbi:hypothetical protein D0Z07_8148 [Hyphodiscus hymeniophilus]|uniref:Zn(2)-C6 fungal-type domain-containing protein n=1 Tax=Hyphodiscus hymeniophilus TaxID=353542 RepID=A0A9P6SKZ5_9HELO|nr:hypothetical protein D0Z07_8148 [Hyphodiscus hymeniophilus]